MKKVLSMVLALMMLMTMCVVPVMAEEPEGSASNPYYVANPMTAPTFVTVPANSAVYYQYSAAVFHGWTVEAYGLSAIIVDGVVHDEMNMWGGLEVEFNFTMISPGIVGYVNDTAEEVQVSLTHTEPAGTVNNPAELADGDNAISIPVNIMNYVAVYMPMADGEYTFSTAQAEDFQVIVYTDGDPDVGTAHPLVDGSLTLSLESYIPVYVTMTAVGMTGDITLTVTAPEVGTANNPIWLDEYVMGQAYSLEGTDPLYFSVDGFLAGSTLLIESMNGTDLTVMLDGVTYTAEGGALYLPLDSGSWYMELVISQAEDASNALYFSLDYYEGHMNNPIGVVDGDNAISIPEGSEGYYYEYAVEKDGLLVVTPADVNAISGLSAHTPDYMNYAWMDIENGDTCVKMPVAAGDTIVVQVSPAYDAETWESLGADTVLNIVVKEMALYSDFEDEDVDGWQSASTIAAVEGEMDWCDLQFEVTQNWGNIYRYINVEPNTDYVVSFEMKSNMINALSAKFLTGDWVTKLSQVDVDATEEWADYEVTLNSGDNTSVVLLLQANVEASVGQIFWLDNIIVTKAEDGDVPGKPDVPVVDDSLIVNGDFETGNANGWETWQSTEISADAAHSGSYGAHLVGNGGWGGLLNQTMTVTPGKTYKLSFWINVNATGVNVRVTDGSGALIEGAGGWLDARNVDKVIEWVFTATDDTVLINFCGSGASPEDIYVDDCALTEMVVKEPSFDGYIYNGDFETGDLTNWINLWDSCDVSFVEGYESDTAISIIANSWSQVRQNEIAVQKNTDYVVTAWVKANTNFGIIVKAGDDSADISSILIEDGAEWQQVTLEFNSGDLDSVCVLLIGWDGGGSAVIDNVSLAEVEAPVVPDYIPGDTNGDGRVNNKDLGLLQQYLGDWEVAINLNAADVNGDGRVNNKDLGLLQQYLGDWDVELQYGAIAE